MPISARDLLLLLCFFAYGETILAAAEEPPKAADSRLTVELFAAAPEIVTPVSIACDNQGRLLVIESHTHFRPKNYAGPERDRIRLFADTNGDGRADKITTFFEGPEFTMDLAQHPSGWLYVATRNEIFRIRDTNGDDVAEARENLVKLETKGNYPHNGLSGLAFDFAGNLYFGLGENLGEPYKLSGSDGHALEDGGEGGGVFQCTAEGGKLRRVATGFWNPFGVGLDIFGHIFAVDNDPDSMPPCRMLHVVENGDYGYEFRYGRSGRHPFQAWNGQLPGTLPQVTGVGEGPCELLPYESDGLPPEYLGNLLVTSWADHRVERYEVKPRGSSFVAERKPFIQGGANFRPVGLALAPDGSLYVSDWVKSDYNLHGQGALWHIRWKDAPKPERPTEAELAILSRHRPLREAAAHAMLEGAKTEQRLTPFLKHADVRVRATTLAAMIENRTANDVLHEFAAGDESPSLRAMAVRAMVARGSDVRTYEDGGPPEVRREAIAGFNAKTDAEFLSTLLADNDLFLRHAAVRQLANTPHVLRELDFALVTEPLARAGVLLAHRAAKSAEAMHVLSQALVDDDETVRLLAIKWVADAKIARLQSLLDEGQKTSPPSVRLAWAYATAGERLTRNDVNENRILDAFVAQLNDDKTPPEVKAAALRMIPGTHGGLKLPLLSQFIASGNEPLALEAVRALAESPAPERSKTLLTAVRNEALPVAVRAEALVGIAGTNVVPASGKPMGENPVGEPAALEVCLSLAAGSDTVLRSEAIRTLATFKLSAEQQARLETLAQEKPETAPLVARVLGKPIAADRPKPEDITAWLARLEGPADVTAGRRVFFHPRLASCARCHRIEGRGADIGPDLSTIGMRERRQILESILTPSANVAPNFQAWAIATNDGRTFSGLLVHTHLDDYTYVNEKGERLKVNTTHIAEAKPLATSIMPTGLVDLLTDQELRDLVAFLGSCK